MIRHSSDYYPLLLFDVCTYQFIKGESVESRIIYTLTPGGENCKHLVKGDLQVFVGQSLIMLTVLFIIQTKSIQIVTTSTRCTGN